MVQSKPTAKNPIAKKERISRSLLAGLMFPVGRIHRQMRENNECKKIRTDSAVFMTSVLEYLTAEVVDLSGSAAAEQHKKIIKPCHIAQAVKKDNELQNTLSKIIIAEGGVSPNIEEFLRSKPKGRKSAIKVVKISNSASTAIEQSGTSRVQKTQKPKGDHSKTSDIDEPKASKKKYIKVKKCNS